MEYTKAWIVTNLSTVKDSNNEHIVLLANAEAKLKSDKRLLFVVAVCVCLSVTHNVL